MKRKNNELGITLISLVVTVIVLVILAGTSIAVIVKNDGLINKAKNSESEAKIGEEKEIIVLAASETAHKYLNGQSATIDDFNTSMKENSRERVFKVYPNAETIIVEFVDTNRMYVVDKEGTCNGPVSKPKEPFPGDITKGGENDGITKPYQINCIEDLVALSIMTNGGNKELGIPRYSNKNKTVELTRDLDFNDYFSYNNQETTKYGDLNNDGIVDNIRVELTKKGDDCIGFTPICNFFDNFDGKNHSIKNLYMNKKKGVNETSDISFFIRVASIKNLTLQGDVTNKYWHAGGFVSGPLKNTKIENCENYLNVTGCNMVGGFIAFGTANISNCTNYGTIEMLKHSYQYSGTGGIVGTASDGSKILNCTNKGKVFGKTGGMETRGPSAAGGMVGQFRTGIIDGCVNEGEVWGGMVGWACAVDEGAKIVNCINYGKCVGGMVYVTGAGSWPTILNLEIENCVNFGEAKRAPIVGIQDYICAENKIYIKNCYNAGNTKKPIVDSIVKVKLTILDAQKCYNDPNKTKDNTLVDELPNIKYDVTNLTEQEMKSQNFVDTLNSYRNAENIYPTEWRKWKLGENGYPILENK